MNNRKVIIRFNKPLEVGIIKIMCTTLNTPGVAVDKLTDTVDDAYYFFVCEKLSLQLAIYKSQAKKLPKAQIDKCLKTFFMAFELLSAKYQINRINLTAFCYGFLTTLVDIYGHSLCKSLPDESIMDMEKLILNINHLQKILRVVDDNGMIQELSTEDVIMQLKQKIIEAYIDRKQPEAESLANVQLTQYKKLITAYKNNPSKWLLYYNYKCELAVLNEDIEAVKDYMKKLISIVEANPNDLLEVHSAYMTYIYNKAIAYDTRQQYSQALLCLEICKECSDVNLKSLEHKEKLAPLSDSEKAWRIEEERINKRMQGYLIELKANLINSQIAYAQNHANTYKTVQFFRFYGESTRRR